MLQVDGIIFGLQRQGGISVYFRELIAYLERTGKPFVVSPDFAAPMTRIHGLIERERRVRLPEGVTVFHSSYYRVPASSHTPVVTTIHDCIYERFGEGLARWAHVRQKRRAIDRSQVLVCISNSTRDDMMRFYPSAVEKRVEVVPNGVSDLFVPRPCPGPVGDFVLYVGARGGYKNFALLAEAMTDLPDLRLIAVGGGELGGEERAFVRNKLENRFQHLPSVSTPELNKLYNSALCLVYPSSFEGFGIPLVEAMKAGCPFVAVRASSIPEVAGAAGILLDQPTPAAISEAIRALREEPFRTERVHSGLERALRFSWENTFNTMLNIYMDLGWKCV